MSSPILLSLTIYGMAIVISFGVAGLIKGIVKVLSVMQVREERKAPVAVAPASSDIPATHVAAIAGAVAAIVGPRHILHIEDRGRSATWTSEGRMIHQTSHAVPHSPKR